MNLALVATWTLASLVGGLGLCRLWQARSRLAVGLGLGPALVLAAFLLPGTRASLPLQVWGSPLTVALVGLGALGLARREEATGPSDARRPARAGTWLTVLLLAAGAWLSVVGAMHLDPGQGFLLVDAPMASQVALHGDAAAHPLGSSTPSLAGRLLGALGGDPLFSAQVLAGACQVLVVLALFGGLRSSTTHALAAVLGAGAILAGTPNSWVVTRDLPQALAHLLGAGALATLLTGSGALAGAVVGLLALACARLDPGIAWPLVLLAALAPWVPGAPSSLQERRAQTVLALLAVLGVAFLGGAPRIGFEASLWTPLVPLALWVAWRHGLRTPLLLGLGEVLVALVGGGFGASVLGAGGVYAAAGELLGRGWDRAEPGQGSLRWQGGALVLAAPYRALVVLALLFLVVQGFEPGETAVNRQVILAGQKQRLSVGWLSQPITLADWVRTRGPAFDLRPGDVDLGQALARQGAPGMVFTSGVETEPLLPSAVIATLAGKPLEGWVGVPGTGEFEVEPAAQLLRLELGRQVPSGQRLLLDLRSHLGEAPALRAGGAPGFRARWKGPAAPGTLAGVEADLGPGTEPGQLLGYRATRDGQPWGRLGVEAEAGRPVVFPVPRTAGTYQLHFYLRPAGADASRAVPLGEGGLPPLVSQELETLGALAVEARSLSSRIPSRSLVPFELVLKNPTGHPVDLARFRSLLFEIEGSAAYPEEARGHLAPLLTTSGQPPGLLAPGGEVRLRAWLPTPLTEGAFRARPVLVDFEEVRVPLDFRLDFQTWRRLPPAGGA